MARTINRTSAAATSPKLLFHFLFRKSDAIGSGQPRAHRRRRRRQQQPAYPTTNTWRELSKSRIQQRPSLIFVARPAIMMVCVSHGSSALAATQSQFLPLMVLGKNATGVVADGETDLPTVCEKGVGHSGRNRKQQHKGPSVEDNITISCCC
jgi:hypothetical protein